MNESSTNTAMIAIGTAAIGGQAVETVNARDLHAFLEIKAHFKDWISRRVTEYGFTEGQDFCSELSKSPNGGRPSREYHLSLDMAKELSMVERNEKGKQARQYFIECERRAKEVAPQLPQTMAEALRLAADQAERLEQQERALQEAAPKVDAYDRIAASDETLTITQAAKVLGVKRDHLTKWMAANGWVYRQNKSWVAYKTQETAGRLVYKEAKYTDNNTGQECAKPYCHVTSKGLAKLALAFGGEVVS